VFPAVSVVRASARVFVVVLRSPGARFRQETAFYQANGVVLVLWSREKLADDGGIADNGARWSGITLAHNVSSRDEVRGVIELARTHGAEISREPADTFYGGYAGVFRDLDGHAWEIAYNPGFVLDKDGSIEPPAADA
jgi:predicted lactoylglutathione lyase